MHIKLGQLVSVFYYRIQPNSKHDAATSFDCWAVKKKLFPDASTNHNDQLQYNELVSMVYTVTMLIVEQAPFVPLS